MLLENNSWALGEGLRDGGLDDTWLAGVCVCCYRRVAAWPSTVTFSSSSHQCLKPGSAISPRSPQNLQGSSACWCTTVFREAAQLCRLSCFSVPTSCNCVGDSRERVFLVTYRWRHTFTICLAWPPPSLTLSPQKIPKTTNNNFSQIKLTTNRTVAAITETMELLCSDLECSFVAQAGLLPHKFPHWSVEVECLS